ITVACSGGGVGGLTFAVAMSRYSDVEVEIFESASQFSPIGAGIGIWPRVWRALVAIGLQDLAQYASRQPRDDTVCTLELRKSDQANGYAFCRIITHGLGIHRLVICFIPAHRVTCYSGHYCVSNCPRMINFVATHVNNSLSFDAPLIEVAKKDDILNATFHWEPEFIELTRVRWAIRWAIHSLRPLCSFVSDKIALLGDSTFAKMGPTIIDKWRWAWETSLDDMIHRPVSTLEEEW
ncbi:Salicylate hydroxylase, partial [Termitomyces sp. J132]